MQQINIGSSHLFQLFVFRLSACLLRNFLGVAWGRGRVEGVDTLARGMWVVGRQAGRSVVGERIPRRQQRYVWEKPLRHLSVGAALHPIFAPVFIAAFDLPGALFIHGNVISLHSMR